MTRTREWDINSLLMKFDPRISNCQSSTKLIVEPIKTDITYKDLKSAYRLAAMIVAEHGEEYLPIFERLQMELDSYSDKIKLVDKAKEIASKHKPVLPT